MEEIIKEEAVLNEKNLETVSGGKHYGSILRTDNHNGYYCYVYKIGYGDCLSVIAQDFKIWEGYTWLARFNGISNPDKIFAGNILYIPVR